jgi:hypothetical protein
MPRSAERLIAAIELMKPHIPPDLFTGFTHELAGFLKAAVPVLESASTALSTTAEHVEPNTTPAAPVCPLVVPRITHAVMTVVLTGLLW